MKKIIYLLLVLLLIATIFGCSHTTNNKEIETDTTSNKYCDTDEDCRCFSGNFCGCYNKDYKPSKVAGYLCDADCMGYPCICKYNICQESH